MKNSFRQLIILVFLFVFHSVIAQVPSANISATTGLSACDSCYDLTCTATGGNPPYTFLWNFSGTTPQTFITQNVHYCANHVPGYGDTVDVTVTDANMQIVGYDTETFGNLITAPNSTPHSICLVSVDSATGKNIVIWDQTTDATIVSYNIYKETTIAGIYAIAGNVLRSQMSTYIDTSSNPAQVAARYELTMLDSCGFTSPTSSPAKTIHLTVSAGIAPAWNLNWDNAEGYTVVKFRIWRKIISDPSPVLIDSVQSSLNSYTDLTPPAGVLYYTLEAITTANCNPSLRVESSTYSSSFSNVAANGVSGININSDGTEIFIYPNPSNGKFYVSGIKSASSIEIFNLFGEKIYSELSKRNSYVKEIDLSPFAKGIYFVKIFDGMKVRMGKIVLE